MTVALDRDLCKACGICSALCPEHVFDRDTLGYPLIARPEDCTACLICELHCPDFALEVDRRTPKKAAAPPPAVEDAAPAVQPPAESSPVLPQVDAAREACLSYDEEA